MKFNVSELAAYCNSRKGKADKEGTLWLKERSDGLFSRKACKSHKTLPSTNSIVPSFFQRFTSDGLGSSVTCCFI